MSSIERVGEQVEAVWKSVRRRPAMARASRFGVAISRARARGFSASEEFEGQVFHPSRRRRDVLAVGGQFVQQRFALAQEVEAYAGGSPATLPATVGGSGRRGR
ncbi:hypothetical protein RLJV_23460 [Pseudomonas aeruginosa]|nr:hypothetical protein RLJV_23460 [Pseudomonas aeruginosa]